MNLWITLLVEVVIYVIMVFVLGPFWYMYLDDLPNEWYVYRWLIKHFHTERNWDPSVVLGRHAVHAGIRTVGVT